MNKVNMFELFSGETEEEFDQEERLEEIRRTSNVIQALENVIAQCEGHEQFFTIMKASQSFLGASRQRLTHFIHNP